MSNIISIRGGPRNRMLMILLPGFLPLRRWHSERVGLKYLRRRNPPGRRRNTISPSRRTEDCHRPITPAGVGSNL